jgi:AraC-like DNA-binding protein
MYQERPSRITGSVAWTTTVGDEPIRVLPDGCIDLIWCDDGTCFVAGPDTRPNLFLGTAGSRLVGLRFAPGFGPRVIGLPAGELTDHRVSIDDVWPAADAQRTVERLRQSSSPVDVLEDIAVEHADPATGGGLIDDVVAMARRGDGVARIADVVGLSDRQLQRRCRDAFGYGAKTLAKILRMNRAVSLARDGIGFAATAAATGYADQAHLARDVRTLTGLTLRELLR